jgi:hypothetical protein
MRDDRIYIRTEKSPWRERRKLKDPSDTGPNRRSGIERRKAKDRRSGQDRRKNTIPMMDRRSGRDRRAPVEW